MLVITRKLDQSIIINGNIEVLVTGITKDGVRLGIIAPREVEVHRREVFEAIAEANRAASAQGKGGSTSIQDAAALLRARVPRVRTTKG
jgi:carbon storage regulator